jgi:hypothetical protein
VAEFHRLPEHPDDCRGDVCCPFKKQPDGMELISIPSIFINGAERDVKIVEVDCARVIFREKSNISRGLTKSTQKKKW